MTTRSRQRTRCESLVADLRPASRINHEAEEILLSAVETGAAVQASCGGSKSVANSRSMVTRSTLCSRV